MGDSEKTDDAPATKYQFSPKEGTLLQEMPAPGWAEAAEQVYRFKAASMVWAIAVNAGLKVTDLRWEHGDLEHGSQTTLRAHVENWDGGPLRFVVQHNHGGEWKHYVSLPATVKGSEASAILHVHHPVLPPVGEEPATEDLSGAQPADLRFTVEEGEAHPQPRAIPTPPQSTSTAAQADAAGESTAVAEEEKDELTYTELTWGTTDNEHGIETTLSARIAGHDGSPLHFIVEHNHGGSWQPYATVPAAVKGNKATATLRVHHPVLPSTGPEPALSEIKKAQPAQLRFKIEAGDAQQQARAPKTEVKASSQKPQTETQVGTLSVTGALVGHGFFILDAKSKPVHAGGKFPVKTDAAAVNGCYFIPGRTSAKFENLPVGQYKVVFPAEPAEGKESAPSPVKANGEGAHVVDIKDFAHRGAILEIEVKKGETAKLQLTLSADGTVRVCC